MALPFGLVTRSPRLVLKLSFGRVNAGCCSFPDLATSGVKDFQAVGKRAVVSVRQWFFALCVSVNANANPEREQFKENIVHN